MKVLKDMFNLNNLQIKNIFINIQANSKELILYLALAFILVLFFKNSMQMLNGFKANYKTLFLVFLCFCIGILSLNKISEFLYFNF